MKKLIILIVFISISSFTFGQFTTITPKIGLTFSQCKDYDNAKYKPGYLFGASAMYTLSPKFTIKPELLIEQKGFKVKIEYQNDNGSMVDFNSLYSWNYLTLPIQVQYSLLKSNNVFVTAGGYAGYMLWASEKKIGGTGDVNNSRTKTDISNYNRFEVGFNAGGGLNIPVTAKNKIEVGLRYERTLRFDKTHFPTGTNTFLLSVGYGINFRK